MSGRCQSLGDLSVRASGLAVATPVQDSSVTLKYKLDGASVVKDLDVYVTPGVSTSAYAAILADGPELRALQNRASDPKWTSDR